MIDHLGGIYAGLADALRPTEKYFLEMRKKGLTNGAPHATMMSRKRYKARPQAPTKGSEDMEGMTSAELTVLLETLAKLVAATAKDGAEAAQIIRDAIPKK